MSSVSSSFSDNAETTIRLANEHDKLNLACTNAHSIVEKVDSLISLFEENALHFCILTETWLTPKKCGKRAMEDLTDGADISFISCLLYTSDAADE